MSAVQRVGDRNSRGGILLVGVPSVLVNYRPIAVIGNPITPHPPFPPAPPAPPHQKARAIATQRSVTAGYKPVVKTGDPDTCGHPRVGGSTNVFVGK